MTETFYLLTRGADESSRTERRIRRFSRPGDHKRPLGNKTIETGISILRSLIAYGWSRHDALAGDEGELVIVAARAARHFSITIDASALVSIVYDYDRKVIVDEEDLKLPDAVKVLRGIISNRCNTSAWSSQVGSTTQKKSSATSRLKNPATERECLYSKWRVLQLA